MHGQRHKSENEQEKSRREKIVYVWKVVLGGKSVNVNRAYIIEITKVQIYSSPFFMILLE